VSIRLRPAALEDMPAIRALLAATWHATYDPIFGPERVSAMTGAWHSEENLRREWEEAGAFPAKRIFLVAESDSQLVATASAILMDDETVKLTRLYVHPDLQRQGLGQAMLERCFAHFPLAHRGQLEVVAGNANAIAFYRRFGFIEAAPAASASAQGRREPTFSLAFEVALPLGHRTNYYE
jgi:GNAT superfamily N-acetyltransferase